MRFRWVRWIVVTLLACLGAGMLVVAFLAYQLRLDNNVVMGRGRTVLAIVGGLCLLLAVAFALLRLSPSQGSTTSKGNRLSPPRSAWLEGYPAVWGTAGALVVFFISLWFITAGTLHTWFPNWNYNRRLGEAFLAGQLHLLETPAPELLALENPYDYRNREGLQYSWDVSLYNRRYYLYWGPAPALIASAVLWVSPSARVEDQHLLFGFQCGLAATLAALLVRLRRVSFPAAPSWTIFAFTVAAGLSLPVFWLVNRPAVYESVIASGLCFLVIGLAATLRGLEPGGRLGWLSVAGLAWGLSATSRLNIAPAIAWLTLLTGWLLLRQAGKWRRVLWLFAPLALCAFGLAWYNTARFGSPFETGHRYQLTGPALPADYRQIASVKYIPPNLYNALVRPLNFSWREFPFVETPFIKESMWPGFISLPPAYYYTEPIAGLLFSTPVVWLALLALLGPLRRLWYWLNERPSDPPQAATPPRGWLWFLFAGAWLLILGGQVVFIASSMRYLAELVPLAVMLAALGLWRGLELLEDCSGWRSTVLFLVGLLCLYTALVGVLGGFANPEARFEGNNLALYTAIHSWFSGVP